jgi:hypothetical protein
VELRAASGGGGPRIGGYASVFGKPSRDLGGFVEVVTPSAFNHSRGLGFPDVIARFNHDSMAVLGTVAGGTLQLEVDKVGLSYTVEPPSTRADIVELVRRGDITRSSFAFSVGRGGDEWDLTGSGFPLRRLLSVYLVDVAPVLVAAYPDSSAGLRSLAEQKDVPLKEVRQLAVQGQLAKLFSRSDAPRRSPAAVRSYLDTRRSDPWVGVPGQSR